MQARSQDLKKGKLYFERVRQLQVTLTQIFIVSTHKFRPQTEIRTLFQPKYVFSAKKKGLRQN